VEGERQLHVQRANLRFMPADLSDPQCLLTDGASRTVRIGPMAIQLRQQS
jgi:hypothetical protein